MLKHLHPHSHTTSELLAIEAFREYFSAPNTVEDVFRAVYQYYFVPLREDSHRLREKTVARTAREFGETGKLPNWVWRVHYLLFEQEASSYTKGEQDFIHALPVVSNVVLLSPRHPPSMRPALPDTSPFIRYVRLKQFAKAYGIPVKRALTLLREYRDKSASIKPPSS